MDVCPAKAERADPGPPERIRRHGPWLRGAETRNVPSAGSGSSQPIWGGTVPCRKTSTALIRPAMPAADMVWPMLALTDDTWADASGPNTSRRAASSTASPAGVAVPWHSTRPTVDRVDAGVIVGTPQAGHLALQPRCHRPFCPPVIRAAAPRITA